MDTLSEDFSPLAIHELDDFIAEICGQQLVSTTVVIDKLLDIRSTLTPVTDEEASVLMDGVVDPS